MKASLILIFTALFAKSMTSQDIYLYTADLKNIINDKIAVELTTPAIKEPEIIFSFARVIPGSYSQKNFGKYIDNFTAYNKEGKELKTKRINKNQFQIKDATQLSRITYQVNDTWDTPDKDFIFQPGGSNIEADNNIVMNNHAFFGYLEGYSQLPFEIRVIKPAQMYASTHLEVGRKTTEEDILHAKNYVYLADNPIFYCRPDTTSFAIGSSIINISVYSARGKVTSNQVAGYLRPMALALQAFFKKLPVDSYQFLFYFEAPEKALSNKDKGGGGYGALEHNYSSLYFLPEMAYEPELKSMVNDVTSHEFLHILTPLNLHSEHIEYFDFINPKMSKHLWLYEGVTEYFSHLVQLQQGLYKEKAFFKNMRDKINQAEEYGDFSMTVMSENVLDDKYQKKYSSVYNRGALIAFMLDIFIREKTANEKDLKKVVLTLADKYGAGKPFKDNDFFAEFVQASHPEVQSFIDNFITGEQALPFKEYFAILGYEYEAKKRIDAYFVGKMGLKYDENIGGLVFTDVEKKNALDIQEGDVFVALDGEVVTNENLEDIWDTNFRRNTTKTKLSVTVKRAGKEKILSGELYPGYVEAVNYIGPVSNPGSAQKTMLDKFKTTSE
jgi:predicted metalloprotease with PDZ domain